MKDSPLEMIARQYDNVVQYDENGNPSIFVKFHKMKSSDLDASLPGSVHPAFLINGEEQDYILMGKFKSAEVAENGTLYSLPNLPPRVSLTYDEHLERMRAAGNGASGITIAEHGLLLLLAHKNNLEQRGNNRYGSYSGVGFPGDWFKNYPFSVGSRTTFRGWLYRCLIEHESSNELRPDNSPLYWERVKQVGGTVLDDPSGYYDPHGLYTINGSGPLDWYMGSDITSVCDIVGNCREAVYGVRLVNCEIQILSKGNDAANADADMTENAEWKAIKPGDSASSYQLVAPGTPGTLHYIAKYTAYDGYTINDGIEIDTVEPEFTDKFAGIPFKNVTINTDNIPNVPSILYELGLAPIPGMTVYGDINITMTQEEQIPYRAGYTPIESSCGMASLDFMSRSAAHDNNSSRARSMPNP